MCHTQSCNDRVKARQGHQDLHAESARSSRARIECRTRSCNVRVKARQWRRLQARLSPAERQMLARLRACETRGMGYPHNYRQSGHHFGAYQYSWGPGSAGARAGFTVRPDRASPAEQDVRTARFYAAHRGEWACPA